MPPLRFVQFSDVHLDSTIAGALNLPANKITVLQQDICTALARACALASEIRADLVLVPGDLFDFETVRPETAAYAADLFRSISPTPVFIAPGNHDSLWPGSPYTDPGGPHWPDNVHIFKSTHFSTVALPEIGCSITGIGHAHRGVTDRLPPEPVGERMRTSFLLFHGSREAFLPGGKETVIPFTDEELLAQGFTYAAIGHYHSLARICGPDGSVRGAYSGCLQGRDTGECGEKCALIGEVAPDGRVNLEIREVAERRVLNVEVDVTGARDNDTLIRKIEALTAAAGARQQDLVCLSMYGSAASTLDIDALAPLIPGDYFHLHVNTSRVTPDYDLEALAADSAAPSLKSAFVRRMMEMSENCESDERRQMLRDAIYYGLYALDGRRLEPRDAD